MEQEINTRAEALLKKTTEDKPFVLIQTLWFTFFMNTPLLTLFWFPNMAYIIIYYLVFINFIVTLCLMYKLID